MKMVIADGVAPKVALVFDAPNPSRLNWLTVWMGIVLFSVQIFADFAGYSSIAIGLAMLMGIKFPVNFNYPYLSSSLSEFWTRWHITLSRWLRDYLYIPLGGNRLGNTRTYLNLMITMLLGGLWHGASWTFVAWGAMHGAALSIERITRGRIHLGAYRFDRAGRHRLDRGGHTPRINGRRFHVSAGNLGLLSLVNFLTGTFDSSKNVRRPLPGKFRLAIRSQRIFPADSSRNCPAYRPIKPRMVWLSIHGLYARTVAAAMVLAILIVQRPGKHRVHLFSVLIRHRLRSDAGHGAGLHSFGVLSCSLDFVRSAHILPARTDGRPPDLLQFGRLGKSLFARPALYVQAVTSICGCHHRWRLAGSHWNRASGIPENHGGSRRESQCVTRGRGRIDLSFADTERHAPQKTHHFSYPADVAFTPYVLDAVPDPQWVRCRSLLDNCLDMAGQRIDSRIVRTLTVEYGMDVDREVSRSDFTPLGQWAALRPATRSLTGWDQYFERISAGIASVANRIFPFSVK